MVQDIDRPFDEEHVPFRIDVVAGDPGDFSEIVDIDIMIHDDDDLGEHHLAQPPEAVHDLARVGGIFLFDRDDGEVVKDAVRREIDIHDLRKCQAQQRQKDPLRGLAQVNVLHGRSPDDGRWVDGLFLVRDAGDMEDGVIVG